MMFSAALGNPDHPEYGVATIPFPIPKDQCEMNKKIVIALAALAVVSTAVAAIARRKSQKTK